MMENLGLITTRISRRGEASIIDGIRTTGSRESGSRYDKWAADLSVPTGTKIRQAIQSLAELP
jgi:hypothetical protein